VGVITMCDIQEKSYQQDIITAIGVCVRAR
jgi:hypothetical protein